MFDQSFVNAERRSKRPLGIFVSLIIQGAILALSILFSIAYTQGLPAAQLRAMLVLPKPPVITHVARGTAKVATNSVRRFRMTDQAVVARTLPQSSQVLSTPIEIAGAAQPESGGNESSEVLGVPGNVGEPAPYLESNSNAKQTARAVQRVGGAVAQANLIHQVQPVYPHLAKAAGVQGTVEFTAVISVEGAIEHLQLVSGHPLLINAAREAVLQWRYRPTLLNGTPVEVVTQITVRFSLTQ